jgi:hypothetical protein
VSSTGTIERPSGRPQPTRRTSVAGDRARRSAAPTEPRRRTDDWPRTGRALPWMIAAFIAMLWLIPFDTIQLTVSLPFDLHLDRIILPFILLGWGLVFAGRRRGAIRFQLTPIHAAIGVFVLVAFLSVLVNGAALTHALLIKDTIKQLLLLCSYVLFFLVVTTTVRATEIRAFLNYTLVLAVLCALGTLVEFRFHYNPFYRLSGTIFPSALFQVGKAYSSGLVDEIGRTVILGPGEVGLEVASMLAMAIPIAIVGLLHAKTMRARIMYGLAASVILAAGLATDEKTSLVAPLVGIVAVVAFRPRLATRLLPLVVVMILAAHVLAPGAIGSVTEQFSGKRLGAVGTTQHRQDGYDAIRPLVWGHPVLGMGYGSYNGVLNRILDNQMLDNLINTGIIGEIVYIMMPLVVVATAVPMIRRRRLEQSRDALAAGACAVVFLTVSIIFDDMSFPHVPYIFLTASAFVAVLYQESTVEALARAPRTPARAAETPASS